MMIYYLTATLFLFFFISNINLVSIGSLSRYMWVIIIFIWLAFKAVHKKSIFIKVSKSHISFVVLYFFFSFWMIFTYLRTGTPLEYSISYLTLFVILISTVIVVNGVLSRFSFERIVLILSFVYLIQALSVIMFFISPNFKLWIIDNLADSSNIDFLVSIRSRGISGSGAAISVYLSFGFFYLLYLLGETKSKFLRMYSYFGFSILLLAIFLSARTGFLICAFLTLSLLFYYLKGGNGSKFNKNFFVNFTVFPILLPLAFYLFGFAYELIFTNDNQTVWGEDSLSAVSRWVFSETNKDSSTITFLLENHIVINTDVFAFIFGDPNFLANANYHTDSGYLRTLNNFGVIGFILYYSSFLAFFWLTISSTINKLDRYLLVGLAFSLLFVEMKEPFLYKHLIISSFVFSFVLFGCQRKKL